MNRKLKYIGCIILTLVVTLGVIFMPYFYYDATDRNSFGKYESEKINFTNTQYDMVDIEMLLKLISDDNSIWMKSNEQVNDIDKTVEKALNKLDSYLTDDRYAKKFMASYMGKFSELIFSEVDPVIVSGVVGDNPVSVSFVYIEGYSDDLWFAGVLDVETEKFYALDMFVTGDGEHSFDVYANYADDGSGEEIREYLELPEGIPLEIAMYGNQIAYNTFGYDAYNFTTKLENIGIYAGNIAIYQDSESAHGEYE